MPRADAIELKRRVEDNLVKACVVCNMVKGGVLDEEEMLFVGPHLRQRARKGLGGAF